MKKYMLSQKCAILGVGVDPINLEMAVNNISRWIASRSRHYVYFTPAHSVMQGYRHPDLKKSKTKVG
jgi:UDP-N-acetyl-D-mannosaminuronic acid transferase (WecB/TagA/CpsF family)